jgi:hypothetical protein
MKPARRRRQAPRPAAPPPRPLGASPGCPPCPKCGGPIVHTGSIGWSRLDCQNCGYRKWLRRPDGTGEMWLERMAATTRRKGGGHD